MAKKDALPGLDLASAAFLAPASVQLQAQAEVRARGARDSPSPEWPTLSQQDDAYLAFCTARAATWTH
jgi:hypothetical protein